MEHADKSFDDIFNKKAKTIVIHKYGICFVVAC